MKRISSSQRKPTAVVPAKAGIKLFTIITGMWLVRYKQALDPSFRWDDSGKYWDDTMWRDATGMTPYDMANNQPLN